jgi:uncharacterized protein
MEFEWDSEKAAANLQKHGVSFDDAAQVFHDPVGIEDLDDRFEYGEERIVATGLVQGVVLKVTCTMRDDVCRIISARKATKHEEQDYYIEAGNRWTPDAQV